MGTVISKKNVPFGCVEPKPLKGFPPGRARVRIRNNGFPSVYIKTDDGIRHWVPEDTGEHWEPAYEDTGEHWEPAYEQGRNHFKENDQILPANQETKEL